MASFPLLGLADGAGRGGAAVIYLLADVAAVAAAVTRVSGRVYKIYWPY